MGTIKIGSSNNQKGITIDPSIVLFNGNNVKKIMKDATTIWEDLKALIPTMTSNSMDGITLSASSVNTSSQDCYKACDGDPSTVWYDSTTASGSTAWFKVAFSEQKRVKKMHFVGSGGSDSATVKLQGSNDNSNFTDLTSEINVSETDIVVDKIGSYKYYRIYFNNVYHNASIGAAAGINVLQLYGN